MVIRDDFDKSNVDIKNWKQDVYDDVQKFIADSVTNITNFKNN